ncbi:ATP-binding cassette domain-containing protein [Tropicimonas sp.]|uniref:ATP-binding cassette domain-containing protein n=1 Tax=Tropicimonas sp. TaxID=2067044 RepID=UPI003A8C50C1
MLTVRGVWKTYDGGIRALQDVSLDAGRGVFGLLGPNGAGKSSLMRTLATLQRPDSGSVSLDDTDLLADPFRARRRIGYLPQDMGVYPRVTAGEMPEYLAGLKGIGGKRRRQEVSRLLEQVNLADLADRRLDTFSGGMRRRFGIATAFLGAPELVIVDEPTAGLDPSERRRFQFLLADAAQSCVLILSSHIVEDLAGLCTDMALMNRGRIVATGAPRKLVGKLDGRIWQRGAKFGELAALQSRHTVLSWRPSQGGLAVRVLSDISPGPDFEPSDPDLEDLYAARMREAAE